MMIQISDDGPGIDPEDLALVFEPFYRADPSRRHENGSVGLGLALAQEFVHLLGGRITVANRPEGGAAFTLNLPMQPIGGVTMSTDSTKNTFATTDRRQ